MKQAKWFIHPIFVFVLSTAALAISLFLYIYWYIGVSAALKSVIARYRLDANQFFEAQTWVVILILSLLVGVILAGILIIFIYNLKTLQLYRLQHTFINNFTHELKTPVTSLKLYLETFAKHELPREEQLRYIGFMLQDAERLSGNINSILNLARIESRLYEGEFDTGRSGGDDPAVHRAATAISSPTAKSAWRTPRTGPSSTPSSSPSSRCSS